MNLIEGIEEAKTEISIITTFYLTEISYYKNYLSMF